MTFDDVKRYLLSNFEVTEHLVEVLLVLYKDEIEEAINTDSPISEVVEFIVANNGIEEKDHIDTDGEEMSEDWAGSGSSVPWDLEDY